MYWFRRPPYLRWTAAVIVVTLALWMDLRREPTELRPFAVAMIEAGTAMEPDLIEYLEVPAGLLPEVELDGITVNLIQSGEPIIPALLSDRGALPEGWWALEMQVPSGVAPGSELRLVVEEDGVNAIPAIVTAVVPPDPLDGWSQPSALVAIPADRAGALATPLSEGRVRVLIVSW